ncbi:MAG TPA: hypothetical protein VM118_06520 [Acidobacteriota bacterium]|nr:hypothetical protein [Acidobacteriota bacterium]
MSQLTQSVFGRITAVVTACALTFFAAAVPTQAEPNEPDDWGLITIFVVGVAAGIVAGLIVHEIVKEPAPSPYTPRVRAWGKTKIHYSDSTTIQNEGYIEVDSRSVGLYTLPDDIPDLLPLPPSFELAETGSIEGTVDNQLQLSFSDINEQANVLDPGLDDVDEVSFEVIRTATATWTRPESAVGDGLMTIDINVEDLVLSTVSMPLTTGGAAYELEISSPELGVLFAASGYVKQDGDLVAQGSIDPGAYVTSSGSGHATLDYSTQLTAPVPASLSSTTLDVRLRTVGSGTRISDVIPTLSEWGLIILGTLVLAATVWIAINRRRRLATA